jgi:hypothetical protein
MGLFREEEQPPTMTLTIDLPPQLEAQLREEAARAGLDAETFIRNMLEERVRQAGHPAALPPHLSGMESDLLQKINQGLPSDVWQRYHQLVAKRRAETLTPEEQEELIALSDQIEMMNVRRIEHLAELAHLRQTSLEALMEQLGIKAPEYA